MPSLNILQWYDFLFVEMEANLTLLLTKKKMTKALGFIGNRKIFFTHFLKNKSYCLNDISHISVESVESYNNLVVL